jgi:hypothetical protein
LLDFIVLAKVAIVAIFPNVATARIEERVVTPAIRELEMVEDSRSHDGLGLKDWLQCNHGKKHRDEREDRLRVKVRAHVIVSNSESFHSAADPRSVLHSMASGRSFPFPHPLQMVAVVQSLPPLVAVAVA